MPEKPPLGPRYPTKVAHKPRRPPPAAADAAAAALTPAVIDALNAEYGSPKIPPQLRGRIRRVSAADIDALVAESVAETLRQAYAGKAPPTPRDGRGPRPRFSISPAWSVAAALRWNAHKLGTSPEQLAARILTAVLIKPKKPPKQKAAPPEIDYH